MKRVLLLSGGMDSTALCYWMPPELAVTVDYGQRSARGEIRTASAVCRSLGVQHRVLRVDCRELGSGELAGVVEWKGAPVPEWWPYRNQLLATLVAPIALSFGAAELTFGAVSSDSTHIDGTARFFSALDGLISMQEGAVRVAAPAVGMTTEELVRASGIPDEILAWAHSCHRSNLACGRCRGCEKHRAVTSALYGRGY